MTSAIENNKAWKGGRDGSGFVRLDSQERLHGKVVFDQWLEVGEVMIHVNIWGWGNTVLDREDCEFSL